MDFESDRMNEFKKVSTLLEQYCKTTEPTFACLNWFHRSKNYCAKILLERPTLWSFLKNMFFKEPQHDLIDINLPTSIPPEHLTVRDCHNLLLDVFEDYLAFMPEYLKRNERKPISPWTIGGIIVIVLLLCYIFLSLYRSWHHGKPVKSKISVVEKDKLNEEEEKEKDEYECEVIGDHADVSKDSDIWSKTDLFKSKHDIWDKEDNEVAKGFYDSESEKSDSLYIQESTTRKQKGFTDSSSTFENFSEPEAQCIYKRRYY